MENVNKYRTVPVKSLASADGGQLNVFTHSG